MRWYHEKPVGKNDFYKTRIIERFLWFPMTINYETRWLERAVIEQKVTYRLCSDPNEDYCMSRLPLIEEYYWANERWVGTPANLK